MMTMTIVEGRWCQVEKVRLLYFLKIYVDDDDDDGGDEGGGEDGC